MPSLLEEIEACGPSDEFSSDTPATVREFLICDYCFWSASSTKSDSIARCPLCSDNLTHLPILQNDVQHPTIKRT
ncbi:MAG: hypothetical protein ABI361_13710 [Nitrososphaera sp.]